MNPFALGMIALGAVLLLLGWRFAAKRRKATGMVLSLLGLAAAATPFVTTFLLFR